MLIAIGRCFELCNIIFLHSAGLCILKVIWEHSSRLQHAIVGPVFQPNNWFAIYWRLTRQRGWQFLNLWITLGLMWVSFSFPEMNSYLQNLLCYVELHVREGWWLLLITQLTYCALHRGSSACRATILLGVTRGHTERHPQEHSWKQKSNVSLSPVSRQSLFDSAAYACVTLFKNIKINSMYLLHHCRIWRELLLVVSGTIVHSCVSVNTVLGLVGILILGRIWKCWREESGSWLSALGEIAR